MLRFSIMPVTLTDPANYERFYLEYLKTSLFRYTEEMQDLVGPDSVQISLSEVRPIIKILFKA